MTRPLLTIMTCLVFAAVALAPATASAADQDRYDDRDDNRDRDPLPNRDDQAKDSPEQVMSLDEAMAQAEKRYRARAVHGEEKRDGDRIVYRIRLLDKDGRVFEVSIDAGSARQK